MITLQIAPGPLELRLRCLSNQPLIELSRVSFFICYGTKDTALVVSLEDDEIILRGQGKRESSVARVLWICRPIAELGGRRRLGLPVVSLFST